MILHLFSSFRPPDPDNLRRYAVAQSTWPGQPWTPVPVADGILPRLYKEEGKSLPFLRDVLDLGTLGHPDDTIAIYTNGDVAVASYCALLVAAHLQEADACYAYRRDFPRLDAPLRDDQIPGGQDYCGRDLFAFRVGWWRAHRKGMPDMLIAREAWDPCLGLLIGGTNPGKPVVVPDVIYHERHNSFWEGGANRWRVSGQIHNLRLAIEFMRSRGIDPIRYGVHL